MSNSTDNAWIIEWAKDNADLIKKHWRKDGKKILVTIKHYAGVEDEAPTTQHFPSFWDAYPKSNRKVDRAGCERIWARNKLDEHSTAVLAGLEAIKRSEDWTKSNGSFIPSPAVFLNQRRWEAVETTAVNSIFAGSRRLS